MATIEIASMLKVLQGERAHALQEVAKLDKAIASLRQLSGASSAAPANGRTHRMSAAARRKIAKAQRARWARVKKEQKANS